MMELLHRLWAFLKRDYLLASASRLAFLWQAVSIFFVTPMLFYLGRLMQPAASEYLGPFGGDYFAFVIVGVAFFGFLSASMAAPAQAIRYEQMIGTLDALLVAPATPLTVAAGASLWSVLVAASQGLLYLILGVLVFRLDIGHADVVAVGVTVLLTLGLSAALGMISAAFVIAFRQPDALMSLFAAASALLGGVFYPTSVLPPALQRLAEFVPLTHALRALRLALLQGYGVGALQREVAILLVFLALLAPIAMIALWWAIHQAKASGTLGAY